jgi:hypothetical protein
VTLPAVRPCRPFQCPRGGDGRQTLSSPEKARKCRRLALKSKRRAGSGTIRWRVVVRLRRSYAAMIAGRAGRLCRCKPAACPCRSFPTRPPGGAGGRRGGLATPHETLTLGVRSPHGRHGPWAKARAWYQIQRAGCGGHRPMTSASVRMAAGLARCDHPTGAQLTTCIGRQTRLERRFVSRSRQRRPRIHSRRWRKRRRWR